MIDVFGFSKSFISITISIAFVWNDLPDVVGILNKRTDLYLDSTVNTHL